MARRLHRSGTDRWIGGVCGGLAEYTGADPSVVRVLVAAATVLGLGSLVIFYLVAWLIIPGDPTHQE